MDFELSDDQVALCDGIRDLCQGRFDIDTVRGLADCGGVDRQLWGELADTGVFSLVVPEDEGGVGLGWVEAGLVFEQLGRALVPGPLVGTLLGAGEVDDAVVGLMERPYGPRLGGVPRCDRRPAGARSRRGVAGGRRRVVGGAGAFGGSAHAGGGGWTCCPRANR